MWKILCLGVLLLAFHLAVGETECPEPDDIKPCTCFKYQHTTLLCDNVTDVEALRKVFVNSKGNKFGEVRIEFSTLEYLPHEIFENVEFSQMHLKNVKLSTLFDKEPKALDELKAFEIKNCTVESGIIWKILEPLKGLRTLDINFNTIKTLGKDLMGYVSKELEKLRLYATETESIKPGAFTNHTNLNTVAVDAGKLTTLTRDIFPTPFNAERLSFSRNKLTTIPEDFFRDMSNLKTLDLSKNEIGTLEEKSFGDIQKVAKMEYLSLLDNPLKCDCRLVWLMGVKPIVLRGQCASPKQLAGKQLGELSITDFNC